MKKLLLFVGLFCTLSIGCQPASKPAPPKTDAGAAAHDAPPADGAEKPAGETK